MFKLIDAVDDLDDVQNVFSNADIPDEVMEAVDGVAGLAPVGCEEVALATVSKPGVSPRTGRGCALACEQMFDRKAECGCACSGSIPA